MLFLNGNDASVLRHRVVAEPHARALAETILAQAQAIMAKPLIDRRFEVGRPVMLQTSRLMADRVFLLGVAFFLTGGQIYRRRLIDEMLAACSFPDWNRSHFLDTAEMVAAIAIGRDWCKPLLTSSEKRVIDAAIVDFGLFPGLRSLISGSAWTKTPTNWNIVCCGGLIVAAVVMDDAEISGPVLEKACSAIRIGLAAYGQDGGWPEGASYWEYATRFAVLAFAALESKGSALLTVDEFPALARTWRFGRALTAPSGMVFDSGDSIAISRRLPVYGWLAQKNNDREAAQWQWQAPGDVHPLDLLWYTSPSSTLICEATRATELFRDAGYATLQNTAPQQGVYLAIQGGSNSTNHAHLDLGTFVLEYQGIRFVSDLGRGDYSTAGYFEPDKRFTHFLTRTCAHNTITFDERDQSLDARADFIASRSDSEVQEIACCIDDPGASFLHYRGFALWDDGTVVVLDRLMARTADAAPCDLEWSIHTQATVAVHDSRLDLVLAGKRIYLWVNGFSNTVPAVELIGGGEFPSREGAFSRISLKTAAAGGAAIAAVFSDRPDGDHSARTRRLDRWLEELMHPVLQ
ncbi:heparinase II/III family protein (plasmid) [Rhizobium sp. 32-5/1]|uniref:heparinase II/III domain-containing protein n=1 Tax=Rhizobium sp. 32-5/1 TaxID=3019602 RepID=UPI00240E03CD|nr:heparinase II/III family protein [Rhizobium sp. 32-5/1]WEZ85879.1 heparinase II/III family protein [Rhizobium sp. 32-5/1]